MLNNTHFRFYNNASEIRRTDMWCALLLIMWLVMFSAYEWCCGDSIDTLIIASWQNSSREAQSQLIQYKLFNRNHWTPSKMAKLKLKDSNTCWRCDKEVGTLVYMLYSCEKCTFVGKGCFPLKWSFWITTHQDPSSVYSGSAARQ